MSSSSLTPDDECPLRWKRLKSLGVLLCLGTGLLEPERTEEGREGGRGGGGEGEWEESREGVRMGAVMDGEGGRE